MVDAEGLDRALDRQRSQPGRLGTQLLQMGLISDEDLAKALGMQWGVPAFLPSLTDVQPEALALVPEALARRRRALPLAWEPERGLLRIALADPHDLRAADEIRFATGARKVVVEVAPESVIDRLLARHYEGVETPAAVPQISLGPLATGPPPTAAARAAGSGRGEAVVADPDPRRRRALAGLLEAHGYRVHRAGTLEEAAALAQRRGVQAYWLHEAWAEVAAPAATVRRYADPIAELESALGPSAALRSEAVRLAEHCASRLLAETFEPTRKAVGLVRFLAGRRGIDGAGLDALLLRVWASALDGWRAAPGRSPLPGDDIVGAVEAYERALAALGTPTQAIEALRANPALDPDAVTSLVRWVAGEDLLTRSEAPRRLLVVLPESCTALASHLAATGWSITRASADAPEAHEGTWDAVLGTLDAGLPLLESLARVPAERRPPVFLLTESTAAPDTMFALRLGAEDVLPYDVHPEVLETKLVRAASRRAPERGAVTGDLRDMSLADTLQILSNGLKTAVIAVEGPGGAGSVAVKEGQIVDARVGGLKGEEALYELIRWEEGGFRITPGQCADAVTVQGSTEGLLMEAFRRLDEDRREPEASGEGEGERA